MNLLKHNNQPQGTATMNKQANTIKTSALSTSALKARWIREAAKGKEAAKMSQEAYIKQQQAAMVNSWFN
jgi:hypothetical protein